MKVTYKKLGKIVKDISIIPLQDHSGAKIETKLTKAVERFMVRNEDALATYRQDYAEVDENNCYTDEKGIIKYDEVISEGAVRRFLQFTKEGLAEARKQKALLDAKVVDIQISICTDKEVVNALPLFLKEGLNGILFEWEDKEDEEPQDSNPEGK